MPQARRLSERMDRLIWWLVYGGLFTLAVALGGREGHPAVVWGLGLLGGAAAAAGACLAWVRFRLRRRASASHSEPEGHA